jgi:hypothetical protein
MRSALEVANQRAAALAAQVQVLVKQGAALETVVGQRRAEPAEAGLRLSLQGKLGDNPLAPGVTGGRLALASSSRPSTAAGLPSGGGTVAGFAPTREGARGSAAAAVRAAAGGWGQSGLSPIEVKDEGPTPAAALASGKIDRQLARSIMAATLSTIGAGR